MLIEFKRNLASTCKGIRQSGSSLIEVMVALIVLGVGLLGLVTLQARSVQYDQQAYLYSQATFLAIDIVERVKANPTAKNSYLINFGESRTAATDCSSSACSATQLANWDMAQWLATLTSALPQGQAQITELDGNGSYQLQIELNSERSDEALQQITMAFRI